VTDDSPLPGWRERKKLATRHALSSAALHLAMERGPENVTIEDITARADVSLRTFRNYFASKYEAICAITADRARHIGRRRLGRPVLSRREAFPANGCTPASDARPPERRDHVVGG
jgi:AcrR family transcriptional regulator